MSFTLFYGWAVSMLANANRANFPIPKQYEYCNSNLNMPIMGNATEKFLKWCRKT